MLVNQRKYNLYFFITMALTLAQLKRRKAPAAKSPIKGSKHEIWII